MRILVVGAGGVGEAIGAIARRREFFDALILADVDLDRASAVASRLGDERISAAQVDASDQAAIAQLAKTHSCDVILNACDPRFNPPIFAAAFD